MMSADLHLVDGDERDRIAGEWVMLFAEGELDPDQVAQWLSWCEADPANAASFEAMLDAWDLSGQIDRAKIDAAAPLQATDAPVGRWWPVAPGVWGSIAAALLLFLGAGIFLTTGRGPIEPSAQSARFETERGRVQSALLEDGSRIDLGGRSSLSVRYTRENRLIIAEDGEAHFKVAKNPDRPFVVEAGPLTITAVGTAFSVQRDENSVAVLVTEGVVEVLARPVQQGRAETIEPTLLRVTAGQRLRFDRGELVKSFEPEVSDPATPWREGRLVFRDEPLRLVVARINRYSSTQVEVRDRAIEDLRVTTTVYGDRVGSWLNGVEAVLPVRVRYAPDGKAIITSATTAP
jgi:transmembrane sensor